MIAKELLYTLNHYLYLQLEIKEMIIKFGKDILESNLYSDLENCKNILKYLDKNQKKELNLILNKVAKHKH